MQSLQKGKKDERWNLLSSISIFTGMSVNRENIHLPEKSNPLFRNVFNLFGLKQNAIVTQNIHQIEMCKEKTTTSEMFYTFSHHVDVLWFSTHHMSTDHGLFIRVIIDLRLHSSQRSTNPHNRTCRRRQRATCHTHIMQKQIEIFHRIK